jgi:hypothetical protein
VIRPLTFEQKAVIAKIREIGGPVRPADVVRGIEAVGFPDAYLPLTESSARGRLNTLAQKRCLRKFGRPLRYGILHETVI